MPISTNTRAGKVAATKASTSTAAADAAEELDEAALSDETMTAADSAPVSDPNYMTSLARGLAVIQAFSQQWISSGTWSFNTNSKPIPR